MDIIYLLLLCNLKGKFPLQFIIVWYKIKGGNKTNCVRMKIKAQELKR